MRVIKVKEELVECKDSWSDLSLLDYSKLVSLYSEYSNLIEEQFLVKAITILTNLKEEYLYELFDEDLIPFLDVIALFKLDEFKPEECREFNFNGKLYSWKNMSKLNVGEQISIKILQKGSKTEYDSWLNLLSIMIRPATVSSDEFDKNQYVVDKLDVDMEILEGRKTFIKDIKAINAMFIIQSFMSGRE